MKIPTKLPIIDLAPAFAGDARARRAAAGQISTACIDHGFFYIVGHGVPEGVIDQAFGAARTFFALPEDEKQKVACDDSYRGFTGFGKRTGRREYFVLGHEVDDHDAIGIHYLSITADAASDSDSLPVHTDFGCITLLTQDDAGGLKVAHRTTKEVVDIPPIEGSFVINVGDMLARWSNDRFVSTPHGVVNRSGKERYSLALFYNPQTDAVVDPRQLGVPERNCRYAPIAAGAYLRQARAANAHRPRYG